MSDYAFLHDVHAVLVEILAEVDRLCRQNGIEYSISGGTVLGAVRHSGRFIPWDDDCDVELRAPEYYRFLRAARRDLDTSRFFLQNKKTQRDFPFVFTKIRRHGTTDLVRENAELDLHWGIAVDVFPTFGESRWGWANRLSNLLSGLASAFAYAPKAQSGPYRALYRLRLDGLATRACMRLLQFLNFATPGTGGYTMKFKFGLDKVYIGENLLPSVDMAFEGLTVKGPARPEAYLDEKNDKYGDWRVPAPPPDGTQYHATHILDAHTDWPEHLGRLRQAQAGGEE